jgi:hypothetical protein
MPEKNSKFQFNTENRYKKHKVLINEVYKSKGRTMQKVHFISKTDY